MTDPHHRLCLALTRGACRLSAFTALLCLTGWSAGCKDDPKPAGTGQASAAEGAGDGTAGDGQAQAGAKATFERVKKAIGLLQERADIEAFAAELSDDYRARFIDAMFAAATELAKSPVVLSEAKRERHGKALSAAAGEGAPARLKAAVGAFEAIPEGLWGFCRTRGDLESLDTQADGSVIGMGQGTLPLKGQQPLEMHFVEEGGAWKVSRFMVGGEDVVDTYANTHGTSSGGTASGPTQSAEETLAEAKKHIDNKALDEAEDTLNTFLRQAPTHADVNYELGRVLFLKGDKAGAKSVLKVACRGGKQDACLQLEQL